jgi:Protein of unknown function (DUF1566)
LNFLSVGIFYVNKSQIRYFQFGSICVLKITKVQAAMEHSEQFRRIALVSAAVLALVGCGGGSGVLVGATGQAGGTSASPAAATAASAPAAVASAASPTPAPAPAPVVGSTVMKVPHTGITTAQCYAAGIKPLVSCSSPGAGALNGQQDGMRTNLNTMGYRLVANASAPGQFFAKTECVQDQVTGLIWEGKPDDNSVRDYRRMYSNFGDSRVGDASVYVNAVNAVGLCGKNDWRLPTAQELQLIATHSKAVDFLNPLAEPAVDLSWFPNARTELYWTSTPHVVTAAVAWGVHFRDGATNWHSRNTNGAVRLVRGSP